MPAELNEDLRPQADYQVENLNGAGFLESRAEVHICSISRTSR